ncbi:hypothetical protein [Bradyrhizobium sp. STM 3562]|uniref:hypothetical protein n=1 Tax=Bradyrhizobium sp. STM 3562 TaxID=578924 RepID=UPI00388FEEA4
MLQQQIMTKTELLRTTCRSVEAWKSMQRRGEIALAFGDCRASASRWYTPVDAVAILLVLELAKTYGAGVAASFARAFADTLLNVIAEAEHGPIDALFVMVDLIREADGTRGHLACGAHAASLAMIGAEVANLAPGYTIERVTAINVNQITRTVRANAARLGVDLSGPFMPAPGSTEFTEIMAPFAELPTGMVEASARRKRESAIRRVSERVRQRAMGGRIIHGQRKQPQMQVA